MAALGARSRHGARAADWIRLACLAIGFTVLAAFTGRATALAGEPAAGDAIERQVKAAYLSKFASYIEWPPQAFSSGDASINIGVLGDDSMASDLAQLVAGRSIQGRPIKVLPLRRDEAVGGLHILFIGRAYNQRLPELLGSARGQPLLTVTEADEALGQGSMINFVIVGGRVRFEVSPKAAAPGNVRISARLLSAATRVIKGAHQ